MLTAARILLIIGSILLILEAVLILIDVPNPLGYDWPCPFTWLILGIGLLLFTIASRAFRRE